MEKDPNILKRKITIMELSVIGSVAIILLNIFRWSLVDVLTPFLEPFVEIIVGGFFLILLIRSIVTAISRFKKEGKKALVPLIINAATLLIVFFVPFTRLTIALDFRMNLSAREQVVGMIQNKNLVPNVLITKSYLHSQNNIRIFPKVAEKYWLNRQKVAQIFSSLLSEVLRITFPDLYTARTTSNRQMAISGAITSI